MPFVPVVLALCLALVPIASQAQPYPSRAITIVTHSAPGGPADLLARSVGVEVTNALGQPVLVDNKPGASGRVGIQTLLRAPRDGYTLFTISYTHLVTLPVTEKDPGFNPDRDFQLLTNAIQTPSAVIVHSSVPARTLAEFIAYAKQQGERLNYGTFGIASAAHFGTEALFEKLGVKLTHVPYKSEALSLPEVVSGRLQFMLASGAIKTHVDSGTVRILATTGSNRWDHFADVRTVRELGVDFVYEPWTGFAAASGIPDDARTRIHAALVAGLRSESVRQIFRKVGFESVPTTPEAFAATVRADRLLVDSTIKSGRIKLSE